MVNSCAAYKCKSRWKPGCNISFHTFPVNHPELLKKWVEATKRKDFVPRKNTVLCGLHFTKDDFHERLPKATKEILLHGAVPTVFDFPPRMQRTTPKKRRTINSRDRSSPSSDPKGDGGAGSSKRPDPEGGKRQRGKVKKAKTAFDDDTDGDDPDEPQEDPFAMIEIEEPRIKQEVFDPEEFNEMASQGEEILPNDGSSGDKRNFETIYCTPTIIKEEVPDYVEIRMPSVGGEVETVAAVPEFEQAMIKPEPLDIIDENVDEDESEDEENETKPRDTSRLMWRCPLVSCTEMFSAELEMYQHLNLNHVVKGLALTSKSKKASAPRAMASSGTSGLAFPSSSSPRLSAVTTPAGRSVPTSSCGSVTVTTTTLSYTSVTTTSTPRVSTVSSSTVTSVSSDALTLSASPSPAATPALSTSAPNVTTSSGADASNSSTPPKPNPVTTSQGPQKLVVAPLNNKDPSLGQKFLLLAPNQSQQSQQVQLKAKAIPKPKPLQIFHSTPRSTEDLPDCAKDDSDMFSISLAEIPQYRRVPIKKKLVDVVDCVKLKNIDPDRLLIAFVDDSSDSRGT